MLYCPRSNPKMIYLHEVSSNTEGRSTGVLHVERNSATGAQCRFVPCERHNLGRHGVGSTSSECESASTRPVRGISSGWLFYLRRPSRRAQSLELLLSGSMRCLTGMCSAACSVLQTMPIEHCMVVCYSWSHSLTALQQPIGAEVIHGGRVLRGEGQTIRGAIR